MSQSLSLVALSENLPRQKPVLPSSVKRPAARLLAQQFWLFGYDIRRPSGNLLLEFGFDKHKAPEGNKITSSRYTQFLPDGNAIVLWGFGMYLVDYEFGGLYLSRSGIAPMICPSHEVPDDVWDPDHFTRLAPPRTPDEAACSNRLLLKAFRWIHHYESAVLAHCGETYRSEAIAAWKRPCCEAAQLPGAWESTIAKIEETGSGNG